jgi:eukaryotic-like serine/threonine-protein kinase
VPGRRAGAIGGTLGFVAPEVLVGGSKPTPAADVYAIGALLWVLLTGRLPGAGDALFDDGGVREAIAAICRRCLAAEPDERFPSADAVVGALEQVGES